MMFKLISDQERFWFRFDSNLDGAFTISDLPILLHQLFFLPGDLVYYFLYYFTATSNNPLLIKYYMVIMNFLEIENMNNLYGNFLSGIFSFFVWLFGSLIIYLILLGLFSKD